MKRAVANNSPNAWFSGCAEAISAHPDRAIPDLIRIDSLRHRTRLTEAYRVEDARGRLLDSLERFRQCTAIAVIQVDVVARGLGDLKSDGLSNHESDGLGFELSGVA